MAIYVIRAYCSGCDIYCKHVGRGPIANCEVCGEQMEFKSVEKYSEQDPDSRREFVSIGYKDTPRYSATLGVSETQIEAAKKLHPQVEWKKFGHSYRPLIRNRPEKLKMMKQANYEEYDPKDFKGRQ